MRLPLWIAEVLVRRLLSRPRYLLQDGPEAPEDADLSDRMLFREVRGGYPKWAHLKCPKCNEHIVLQIAGRGGVDSEVGFPVQTHSDPVDLANRKLRSPFLYQEGRDRLVH